MILASDDDFPRLFDRAACRSARLGEDALDFLGFADVGNVVLLDDGGGAYSGLRNLRLRAFLLTPFRFGDFLDRARVHRGELRLGLGELSGGVLRNRLHKATLVFSEPVGHVVVIEGVAVVRVFDEFFAVLLANHLLP